MASLTQLKSQVAANNKEVDVTLTREELQIAIAALKKNISLSGTYSPRILQHKLEQALKGLGQ